jgi:hypothetical protein
VANFVKDLFRRAGTSMGYVVKPLSDTLVRIRSRRDVQKTLVGFRILHDSSGFPFTVSMTGRLLFLSCFMKSLDRRRKLVSD